MNQNFTRNATTLALALLCTVMGLAQSFKVDGLYYNIISESEKTVEVTYKSTFSNADYVSGAVNVPSEVKNGEVTYKVTALGDFAFKDCAGLTDITLPETVTYIGERTLYGTGWLDSKPEGDLYLNNMYYCYKGTMPENHKVTIKDGTSVIAGGAFSNEETLTEIVIPESVKEIGTAAFFWCSGLTKITLPERLTRIYPSAFENCRGLVELTIPNSVEVIGESAFCNCAALEKVVLPNGLKVIDEWMFYRCFKLNNVVVPESVTAINNFAFGECSKLSDITFSKNLESIGKDVFENTPWYNAQPNGSIYVGNVYFEYKGTMPADTKIVLREGTKGIAGAAFLNRAELTGITMNEGLLNIGKSAFYGCSSLKAVSLPNTVRELGPTVFTSCANIEFLMLPKDLNFVDSFAFYGCTGLKEVQANMSIPTPLPSDAFLLVPQSSVKLYVPSGTSAAYRSADVWKDFGTITEGVSGVEDMAINTAKVTGKHGAIVVTGADEAMKTVWRANGTMVYSGRANRIDVAGGIYLVKVDGGAAVKVMVK